MQDSSDSPKGAVDFKSDKKTQGYMYGQESK